MSKETTYDNLQSTSAVRPDRLWGPPSLLFNEYQSSFLGVQQLGCDDHSPPSATEIKNNCSP